VPSRAVSDEDRATTGANKEIEDRSVGWVTDPSTGVRGSAVAARSGSGLGAGYQRQAFSAMNSSATVTSEASKLAIDRTIST
jgi:hypothetical protein